MGRRFTGIRLFISLLIIDVILIGAFVYLAMERLADLSTLMPGKFGPSADLGLTGNYALLAALFGLNATIILLWGFGGLADALRSALLIGPGRLQVLLRDKAGVPVERAAAVGFAVEEEQKEELALLRAARRICRLGAVLFLVALPVVCIAYTHVGVDVPQLFSDANGPVANEDVTAQDVGLFTADQLAGAVLLDIPEIYHVRFSPLTHNDANVWLTALVLIYRTLVGLMVLMGLITMWRSRALRHHLLDRAQPALDAAKAEHRNEPPMTLQEEVPPEEAPAQIHAHHEEHAHGEAQRDHSHEHAEAVSEESHGDHGHHEHHEHHDEREEHAEHREAPEVHVHVHIDQPDVKEAVAQAVAAEVHGHAEKSEEAHDSHGHDHGTVEEASAEHDHGHGHGHDHDHAQEHATLAEAHDHHAHRGEKADA